ncbi:MAG: hypothetical protein ACK4ZJ_18305, partial [Allorhizobium sp.]
MSADSLIVTVGPRTGGLTRTASPPWVCAPAAAVDNAAGVAAGGSATEETVVVAIVGVDAAD